MIARNAWAIVDADGGCVAVHLGKHNISSTLLERRGFRIVPVRLFEPGELDPETVERCAELAEELSRDAMRGAVLCHGELTDDEIDSYAHGIAATVRSLVKEEE